MKPRHSGSKLVLAAFFALAAPSVHAQAAAEQSVALLADSVFIRGNNILIAQGNVEATRGQTKLTASSITYDASNDQITVQGPIQITDGTNVQVVADFAELDLNLQNGLLKSARLVLNEQVTINAQSVRRIDGRKSALEYATATSCQTCETKAPLWQIRARHILHDEDAQQLFFQDAQFRLFDVPIVHLPRLRLPDPTVERANGFLIPTVRSRSRLSTGVKVPYFITLGDHKDITVTPYLSSNTRTLEWRYRQAFSTGRISFEGAFSKDNFSGFNSRSYLFGEGQFSLKRDYELSFELRLTSDDAYLQDYDYSDLDRLKSEIAITRANRDENTRFALTHYASLRPTEDNATLPSIIASARTEQRFYPNALGGEVLWELEAHSHYRESDLDTDSADLDSIVDGRDVTHVNAELTWRDTWLTQSGLEFGATANLAIDAVHTKQDTTNTDDGYFQVTPSVAAHLRYPLVKTNSRGVTHLIEPIAQIGWTGGETRFGATNNVIANDESTRVEFDEGNLLSLSRFPSDDRRERGIIGAFGFNWSRFGPQWETHFTVGQILREDTSFDLSESSGLSGSESDILVAGQISNSNGIDLIARGLFDPSTGVVKAEARGGWANDRLDLGLSYVWLDADPDEDRASELSEMNIDSSYRMNRHWTGLANWRYDVVSNTTAEAGIGVEYRNECVKATFEVSRRFASSTTVAAATDLSFTVEILGFSAKTIDKSYARTCSETAQ